MANSTPRFNFTTFTSNNDTLDYRDHKFTGADRILLDQLLTYVVERHTHNAAASGPEMLPPPAPKLTVSRSDGVMPAGTTVYYRTSVVDNRSQEQLASQQAVTYTAVALAPPEPVRIIPSSGDLMAGDYLYAVSAYTSDSDQETTVSRTTAGLLTGVGGFVLSLPMPPSGATGFNVYRKGPTERALRYLVSLSAEDTSFSDTGAADIDQLRGIPTSNTTSSTSSVTIELPAELPADHTCKIYRTYDPSQWDTSLLTWTSNPSVFDTGHATTSGAPPLVSAATHGAPRIRLGVDTEGSLPPGLITTTHVVNFSFAGPVEAGIGAWQWINEFADVDLLALHALLGRESTPASQPVRVAIDLRPAISTLWTRFAYELTGDPITADVPVGETIGSVVELDPSDANPNLRLHAGDALRAVVLQSGGGATPTDSDLSLTVTLAVRHGSATETYEWET